MWWWLLLVISAAGLELDRQVGGIAAVVDVDGLWVLRGCDEVPLYTCHPSQRGVLVNTQFSPWASGLRFATSLTCSIDRAACLTACQMDPSCMAYRPESTAATTFYYTDARGSGRQTYAGFVNHRCGIPQLPCQASTLVFEVEQISLPAIGADAVEADLWLIFYNSQNTLITAANVTSAAENLAVTLADLSLDGEHFTITLTAKRPGCTFELPVLSDGQPNYIKTSRLTEILYIFGIVVQLLVPLIMYTHILYDLRYYWVLLVQKVRRYFLKSD